MIVLYICFCVVLCGIQNEWRCWLVVMRLRLNCIISLIIMLCSSNWLKIILVSTIRLLIINIWITSLIQTHRINNLISLWIIYLSLILSMISRLSSLIFNCHCILIIYIQTKWTCLISIISTIWYIFRLVNWRWCNIIVIIWCIYFNVTIWWWFYV